MRAADLMTREVATVHPDTRIEELCDLLKERGVTGAPVVDQAGRLLGIVSKDDIIFRRRAGGNSTRQQTDIRSLFTSGFVGFSQADGAAPSRVAEIMTKEVLCAPADAPVSEICRLMWEHRVHRIPIVRDGRLVGIVSALDVCRAFGTGLLAAP